jgi:hypothetical protein
VQNWLRKAGGGEQNAPAFFYHGVAIHIFGGRIRTLLYVGLTMLFEYALSAQREDFWLIWDLRT